MSVCRDRIEPRTGWWDVFCADRVRDCPAGRYIRYFGFREGMEFFERFCSYAKRTLNLKAVIDELLENGRSVVAAFHQQGS